MEHTNLRSLFAGIQVEEGLRSGIASILQQQSVSAHCTKPTYRNKKRKQLSSEKKNLSNIAFFSFRFDTLEVFFSDKYNKNRHGNTFFTLTHHWSDLFHFIQEENITTILESKQKILQVVITQELQLMCFVSFNKKHLQTATVDRNAAAAD